MRRRAKRVGRRLLEISQRSFVWLVSLGALAFVGAVGYASDRVLRDQIGSESKAHATRTAELLGESAYAPGLMAMHDHARSRAAIAHELDVATRAAIRSGAILDAVIWTREGRILYSSRRAFVGQTYPLAPAVRAAFAGRETVDRTHMRRTPTDPAVDRLDVTIPVRRAPGMPISEVLDLAVPYARVTADIESRSKRLDTVVIAAGGLLYLLLLPFLRRAGRVARRQYDPRQARLVEELEDAIARRELHLEFQPLIDLRTRRVAATEALVRWNHPRRGPVPPDEFIPIAETSPFFWDFSLHVLDLALAECAECRRKGLSLAVAVNVSSGNLLDPRLPTELRRLLAKHDLPPGALELEVTEGAIMEESQRAAAVLGEVAAVGIGKIAIDDFGTGYSSLARVRVLPIDAVKIDRSFIREMDATGDSALVRSVIALAHNLGLVVVAEGIENPETANRLARLGCDMGQGYAISRPLRAGEIVPWVDAWDAREQAPEPDDERRAGPGRRRDDYFSVAFKNAPEAMLIADDAGRWIDANVAASELLGVDREEVRRRRWGGFTPNTSGRELDDTWQELLTQGSVRGAWDVVDAAGRQTPIEFEATANFLPGLHLFVVRPRASAFSGPQGSISA
ncbi:MAG: EAL domain-containing protein [Thermoleophilaceae bacterium]